jgi:RNA polymerase sigma factor for flagellar operon FliA
VHNQESDASAGAAGRQAALVQQYLPLVQHAVSSISARVPRHVAWDDLVSAGMLGLAEAARSYDPSRGVPFDGYASTRIRGALLDELRSLDWASRSVRTKARLVEERSNALTVQLGRQPTPAEVATHLGLAAVDVQRIVDDVNRAVIVHYDAVAAAGEADDLLPAGGSAPDELLVERERRGYLRDAVEALPERLRVVVEGYFFHERLMQDIADELGVTESRVSQMRAEALALLRDGMNSQLDPDLVAEEERPNSRVAKKKAAYYAAIASNSDFRGRLEVGETPARPAAPRELPGGGLSAAG